MSLKDSDWKNVLKQPKNVGLMAGGGTGMGKTLFAVEEAEKKYAARITTASAKELENALKAVKTQCDIVINKHQKLYTTACNYLKTVKQEADNRLRAVEAESKKVKDEEFEERRIGGLVEMVKALCADIKTTVNAGGNVQQTLANVIPRLEHIAQDIPKYKPIIAKLKAIKPAPNVSPESLKRQYLQVADDMIRG
jgi:hypothetical protein